MPEHYPGIEFNEAGVCNYCSIHKKPRYKGKEELDKFLGSFRNKGGKYDCLVGISGGQDSSYMLYYLAKVCDLRVLAYTADNGFRSDAAKTNVKKMTDILGVELVIEEHDFLKMCVKHNVSSLLRRPSPRMVQIICCGCRLGGLRGLYKCAQENKIPLVALGDGTFVEKCYYKRRYFKMDLFEGKSGPLLMLFGLLYEMIRNPFYLTPTNMSVYAAEYLYYISPPSGFLGLVYPNQKLLRFYHYIEWDEDKILSTIRTELNWTKGASASSWRADCKMSLLKNYLLRECFGFTEKEDYLSNLIRENMISREEALERLKNEAIVPQEAITELCDEIGLNPSKLSVAVEMARKNALRKK
ncbi:MAG: hypothetical protein OEW09_01520 [Anaerolineae bacterium]|nr:hypothetical protein [Anaerolineae bacterium]